MQDDGNVDVQELQSLMESLGTQMNEERLAEFVEQFDTDGRPASRPASHSASSIASAKRYTTANCGSHSSARIAVTPRGSMHSSHLPWVLARD